MKKYRPTKDDLYETEPCPICGEYVLDEGAETCGSDMCRIQWDGFKEDYEQWQLDELDDDWDDSPGDWDTDY